MTILRVILLVLLTAVVLGTGLAVYWLQDANNLKPEIEKLISQNSDYNVRIRGDMDWQLFPPLTLRMADVEARQEDQLIEVAQLQLDMDLSAIWQDTSQWQVRELHLQDTRLQQADSELLVQSLDLMAFRFNQPAPFELTAQMRNLGPGDDTTAEEQEAAAPLSMDLAGTVTVRPEQPGTPQTIEFSDTDFALSQADTQANGRCDMVVTDTGQANTDTEENTGEDDTLLPLDLLQAFAIQANCQVASAQLAGETFTNSKLELHNRDGRLHVMLDTPDFFAGQLATDVTVQLDEVPVQWQIVPEVTGVDSERLLAWAEQDLQWVAMIGMNSTMTMQGNTAASLANTVQAQSTFDGGEGTINVSKIKQQLARIALLSGKSEEVAAWPDVWAYEDFTGDWLVNGREHTLNFVLDNMQVDAKGDYDYLAESIDMLAHVTVHNTENSPFKINPILAGTAIPVRCRGDAADPDCKLDERASRNIIAKALQRDDESGLRAKLEQKIDEEVPEEYRETARNILELLGRSLERTE
ncbi:MAG: AsmA family protein [Pseudomonadota bacterium]